MLPWSIVFVVIALVAALFGFVGFGSGSAGTAQFYFLVLVVVSVLLIVAKIMGRRRSSRATSSWDP
jgi:uncharacterized membrane protein YtjA (UPF0391 family)